MRSWRGLAFAAVILAAPSLTSCSGNVTCDYGQATDTIIGRVIAREGATATFSIESVVQSSSGSNSASRPPELVPGQAVAVRYYRDRSRFLRVGTSYRVELSWNGSGAFESDVHVAGDPCSRGTVYANGRAINTAGWLRSHLGLLVAAIIVVPLLISLLFIVAMKGAFCRRARRGTRERT